VPSSHQVLNPCCIQGDSRNLFTILSRLSSSLPEVFPRSSKRSSMTASVVAMKSTKEDWHTYSNSSVLGILEIARRE